MIINLSYKSFHKIMNIYLVGGSVRDKLLGRKCNDYDFAVEANSYEETRQFILDHNGKPRIYNH